MTARVLVAAEAPMVVGILAHKLRREGHDVTIAIHHKDIVRALDHPGFDCIVCEPQLVNACPVHPVMHNWLAIVDGRDETAALSAMRQGAAGVVRTPFKPTVVAEQVATLLRMGSVTG